MLKSMLLVLALLCGLAAGVTQITPAVAAGGAMDPNGAP
jgi:hypothetical protein